MYEERSKMYDTCVEVRGKLDGIMMAIDSDDFEKRNAAKIEAGFIALDHQTIGPVVAFCNFVCIRYYPYSKLSESQQSGTIHELFDRACQTLESMSYKH